MNKAMQNDAARVAAWLEKHQQWQAQLSKLRDILLSTELTETVKWGSPTYTLEGKNVISLAAFKNHCGLWFHQGVFLQDTGKKLVNAQDGKTKALRQWRWQADQKIELPLVKTYIKEAIENQRAGKALKPEVKKIQIPEELRQALDKNKTLAKQFASLTAGKQREYVEHIASAKRQATRLSRLEKITPLIAAGQGLNDKYRNC